MARRKRIAWLLSSCLLAGNAFAAEATSEPAARAAAALGPFKANLMQALQAGLAESPTSAVQVCRIEAPAIAADAAGPGMRIGRSSHRVRNPGNAPEPWMREIIHAYLADPADRAPRTVTLEGGRIGYAEPILTQPLCTVCHGTTIAPEVRATIAELYPADEATGFEAGDLRGIFWVTLDPAAAPAAPE
jgi:hypothetical protein